ncbi:phage tail terminator protein [Parasedimentitalea psychrophila]|uniref:Uncharacterized protein n=1 Tax=Parasedimentitalea psychrophila TaxID=2997337 RepID=A0A9Y2KZA2_9RHOB|nr:hypothetical protein [Parasedimentitalea psychrophila]WIY25060.1 hypothetical protein QPJ95_21645 [Parasedimentitalea psychrophila]
MIDAVTDRLNTQVTDLRGKAETVAHLADLMRSGRLPENASAIVVPLGFKGGKPGDATGLFTQDINEVIGVLLITSAHDKAGRKALKRIDPLIREVVSTLAGWAPEDVTGVFQVERGKLLSLHQGRMVFQIDFSITDQLRISA